MSNMISYINKQNSVYRLKVEFFNFVNYTYVIVDKNSRQAAIIDPAWDSNKIISLVNELDIKLTTILITHLHYDHVNMVNVLLDKFHPQVYVSAKEIDYYGCDFKNLNAFNDFEIINLGNTQITCLLTSGHTVGSACFFMSDSIFTGDTVFIEGCGICATVGGSAEEMFESIQKIKKYINPDLRVFPGHSYGKIPGYPLRYLIENNIYFLIDKKEYFINFRMRENQKNIYKFV
ncbi:MAG: MBL fold metallo-hydrolase [Bacillota bacterium]|nr:MBL fold metallo-hydrolase [Bacillota bacterium]